MVCLNKSGLSTDRVRWSDADGSAAFRWIVAQEGSRQTYAVPLAFHRLGVLHRFYVDIWCRRGRSLLRRGPAGTRALSTRFHPEIPLQQVVSFNAGSILSRSLLHIRRSRLCPEQLSHEFNHFGRWFARKVCSHLQNSSLDHQLDIFFGFNTNCLETLRFLKERSVFTVVDQVDPARVEEQMVMEETERWPGWTSLSGRMPESYWNRIEAEWDAADCILVNSEWSLEALVQQGVTRDKIIVVPLAIDLADHQVTTPIDPTGALKVLWLGGLLLRKGIQYLVEAARRLQHRRIEFLLAGPSGISDSAIQSFPPNMKMLGRVTRDRLSRIYKEAHLFVLPTISDGFAVTQLEAMAHGLPVVTTPNCGRVVTDGVDGLMVPARDGQALAEAIEQLDDDRSLLRKMSENALQTVKNYDLPSNARMIQSLVSELRHRPKKDRQNASLSMNVPRDLQTSIGCDSKHSRSKQWTP